MRDREVPPVGNRRRFLQLLALAGVSTVVGATRGGRAQAAASSKPRVAAAVVPADSTSTPPADPPISDDAKALATIVQRHYGQHLTAAQLDDVTREIDQRLQGGARLRAVALANGDEPDFTFHA